MIDEASTLDDVAFAVCTALDHNRIEAILTGGSAAAHYAPIAVQSLDADFVLRFSVGGGESAALATIGYTRTPGRFYAHPRSPCTVEFPVGPLAIGTELVQEWSTERRDEEALHVLPPTDCVRDRFIAYYAWGDLSALASALHVARATADRFDERAFVAWARREATANIGYDIARLDLFLARLRLP